MLSSIMKNNKCIKKCNKYYKYYILKSDYKELNNKDISSIKQDNEIYYKNELTNIFEPTNISIDIDNLLNIIK